MNVGDKMVWLGDTTYGHKIECTVEKILDYDRVTISWNDPLLRRNVNRADLINLGELETQEQILEMLDDMSAKIHEYKNYSKERRCDHAVRLVRRFKSFKGDFLADKVIQEHGRVLWGEMFSILLDQPTPADYDAWLARTP